MPNQHPTVENDVPNFMWRGLAETILKRTRWAEWRANGWKWQHEQVTLLARELEEWLPSSEAVMFLRAQAWEECKHAYFRTGEHPVRNPYARPIPPAEKGQADA